VAPPPTVTPASASAGAWIPVAGLAAPAAQPAQPADLNASWRGLMSALGVGLPHHLNRAASRSRTMHRAVR
jgi:hypothetical protein